MLYHSEAHQLPGLSVFSRVIPPDLQPIMSLMDCSDVNVSWTQQSTGPSCAGVLMIMNTADGWEELLSLLFKIFVLAATWRVYFENELDVTLLFHFVTSCLLAADRLRVKPLRTRFIWRNLSSGPFPTCPHVNGFQNSLKLWVCNKPTSCSQWKSGSTGVTRVSHRWRSKRKYLNFFITVLC